MALVLVSDVDKWIVAKGDEISHGVISYAANIIATCIRYDFIHL